MIDLPRPGAARSFWLQEALADDPGEPAPPLEANVVADVCIVGGGFAGLWTAVRLTERAPGMRIALIEQDIVGGGASGRNGGFASSSWFDADAIIALFGEQEGVRYLRVQSDAVEQLGAFAEGARDRLLVPSRGRARRADRRVAGGLRHRRAGVGPRALRRGRRSEGPHGRGDPRVRGLAAVPRGRVLPRQRGGAAGAARARAPAAAPRARRPHLRAHADARARAVAAGDRADRARRGASRPRRAHDRRVGGRHGAVPPELRRDRRLRRGHRADPRPVGRDRVDEPDRDRRRSRVALLPAPDRRRPDRDRRRAPAARCTAAAATVARPTARAHFAEAPARGLLWMFPQLEGIRFTHAWGGPIDQTPTFVPVLPNAAAGQHPRRARVQRARASSRRSSAGTSSPRRCSTRPTSGRRWRSTGRSRRSRRPSRSGIRSCARPRSRWSAATCARTRARSRGPLYRLVGEAPVRYRERRGAPRRAASVAVVDRRILGASGRPTSTVVPAEVAARVSSDALNDFCALRSWWRTT